MIGIVDRIVDNKIAVIKIRGGGEIYLPLKQSPFRLYQGACLKIDFQLDKKLEEKNRKKIQALQKALLKNG